jgi:hypothetical protein
VNPSVAALICRAIWKRARLEFQYNGRFRVVEPYCLGISTAGVAVLRAVQVRGSSSSGGYGFGKLWTVAEIQELRLTDETFEPSDPQYNPDDSAMTEIRCRIE